MKVIPILGIDIAKRTFDVCLRPAAQVQGARHHAAFNNNQKGFRALVRWLKKLQAPAVHACLVAGQLGILHRRKLFRGTI